MADGYLRSTIPRTAVAATTHPEHSRVYWVESRSTRCPMVSSRNEVRWSNR